MLYVSLAIVDGLQVWGYLFIEMDILVLIMLSFCIGLSLNGWISNMELLLLMLSFFIDYAHAYWLNWPIPLLLNWLIWPLLTLSPTFPPIGELTAYGDCDCKFDCDDLLFCCSYYYSLNIISSILVIGEPTKLNFILDCSWWLFCDVFIICYCFGDLTKDY